MSAISGQILPENDSFDFPNSAASANLLSRPEKRRKVLLLGAANTGKTAFLMRYKQEIFVGSAPTCVPFIIIGQQDEQLVMLALYTNTYSSFCLSFLEVRLLHIWLFCCESTFLLKFLPMKTLIKLY